MFGQNTNLHIAGGTFYNVAGDVNMANNHRITTALEIDYDSPLPPVEAPARQSTRSHPSPGQTSTQAHRNHILEHIPDSTDPGMSRGFPFDRAVLPWQPPLQSGSTTNILGGTFIGGNVAEQDYNVRGFHILHSAIAGDAFHNSGDRHSAPRCHPETRTHMLNQLKVWATQNDNGRRVFWLHGPAGAGKSAVAQTLCQELEKDGCLGGNFFFKRGHVSRGTAKRLFCTLSYQLAALFPAFKRTVSQKVANNPSVLDMTMDIQMRSLIMEPLQDRGMKAAWPLVIVIDGLDECEGHDVQQDILRSIGEALRKYPAPLRLLLASRPEPHIREVFEDMDSCFAGLYVSFNIEQSFEDVRTYLRAEFNRIHHQHRDTMAIIPRPWPSGKVLEFLVAKSSGYFIYAATIIRFIDDKNFRPTDRLSAVENLTAVDPESGSPFAALDQLYSQILSAAPPRRYFLPILHVVSTERLNLLSPHYIEQILDLKPGDVLLTLRGLHSVLRVPSRNDPTTGIGVYHASFLDFLSDPARSGRFHIGTTHIISVAQGVLRSLSHDQDELHMSTAPNAVEHVAWKLCEWQTSWIVYITSRTPSTELVPLIRRVKPIFIFYYKQAKVGYLASDPSGPPNWHHTMSEKMLGWLRHIQPPPTDLILLWEQYRTMHFVELGRNLWWPSADTNQDVHCDRLLLQSPSLLRFFQARTLLEVTGRIPTLFEIHVLLNFSWDDLRKTLTTLRCLVEGDEAGRDSILMFMRNPQLCGRLYPGPLVSL